MHRGIARKALPVDLQLRYASFSRILRLLQLPSAHVDEIQMRVVPSELYTNIQSGVACRCIKEEDGIYHYKLHSATSIAVGQIFFPSEPCLLHFAFKKQKPAYSKIKSKHVLSLLSNYTTL